VCVHWIVLHTRLLALVRWIAFHCLVTTLLLPPLLSSLCVYELCTPPLSRLRDHLSSYLRLTQEHAELPENDVVIFPSCNIPILAPLPVADAAPYLPTTICNLGLAHRGSLQSCILTTLLPVARACWLDGTSSPKLGVVVVACSRATLAMALPSVRTLFLPSSFGTFLI